MIETPPTVALPDGESKQQDSTLMVLTILWYVLAGLNVFGLLIGLLYVFIGIASFNSPMFTQNDPNAPPPEFFGWMFVAMGGLVAVMSLVFGILYLCCAVSLQRRRKRTLCFVVSCIACLSIPLGTALGVFTIITLNKPQVRRLFDINS